MSLKTSDTPPEVVIERALQRGVSKSDFKHVVKKHVNEVNSSSQIKAKLSNFYVDFNLDSGLLPVVDFDDTSPAAWRTDTIIITNDSAAKSLYFYIDYVKSPKFDIIIEPREGKIKKQSSETVQIKARVFCTTRVFQLAKIYLHNKNPKRKTKLFWPSKVEPGKTPESAKSPSQSSPKLTEDPVFQYLSFRVESELSSSLDYDDLKLEHEVDRGANGRVFMAKWRGSEVAVKKMPQELIQDDVDLVHREISLMSKLNFQYIVTYMGCTKIPGQPLCIIMEYVPEGSLIKLISKSFEFSLKIKIAMDIIKGLAFLHSNNIAHRDIKPDNVLVVTPVKGAHVNVKLADFGTSRIDARQYELNRKQFFSDESPHRRALTKGVGTLIYSPPEILAGKTDYDGQKTDIYSYGILLWEMFTQKKPFSDPPMDTWLSSDIAKFVMEGKRMEIPESVNSDICGLIKRCWEQDPDKRPNCSEILRVLTSIYGDYSEPYPPEDREKLGWQGEIERDQVEKLLSSTGLGTFLLRWSRKQSSFVFSYKKGENDIQHISGIKQNPMDLKVTVQTTVGSKVYDTFLDYLEVLKSTKTLTEPFGCKIVTNKENPYIVTKL